MEFFELVNSVIDIPNTIESFKALVDIANKNPKKKEINYKNEQEIELNKKGLYILITLINHKRFYDKLPDTPQANEFKENGFIVLQNIKVKNNKIKNIEEICKNLFNIDNGNVSLSGHNLKGPHVDVQNQVHLDRAHPTIKWFLYKNDVSVKNGAFCYSKGSHLPTKEKLEFLYKISCMTEKNKDLKNHIDRGKLGAIRVSKKSKSKEISLINEMKFGPCNPLEYPENTLIIADTSGFHKRGELQKNQKRITLMNQFGYPK